MRIKKSNILNALLWLLMAFYILLAHWIWYGRGVQETGLIMLMAMSLISRRKKVLNLSGLIKTIILLAVIAEMAISAIHANSHEYLIQDLKSMLSGILAITFFTSYDSTYMGIFNYSLKRISKYIFVYAWVNTIIIFIQAFRPPFLMNISAIVSVGSYVTHFDQFTGFLGINGTTRWNLFTCFVILLYFYTNQYPKGTKAHKRQLVATLSFVFASFLASIVNSSRAFVITLPVCLLIYFFAIKKLGFAGKTKYLFIILLVVIVLFLVYTFVPLVHTYVDSVVSDKVSFYYSKDIQKLLASNDDRGRAVDYAVREGGIWGLGIGALPMHSSNSYVKVLGLNSTSSYIILTGIVGYLLTTIYWAYATILSIFKKVSIVKVLVAIVVYLLLSYLLPLYSSFALPILMGLIISVMSLDRNTTS